MRIKSFDIYRSLKEMFLGGEEVTVERVVPTYSVPDFVPDPQFTRYILYSPKLVFQI